VSAQLPPLEAYRRDVERVAGRERFGDADGEWVVLAHTVWRLAAVRAARPERTRPRAKAPRAPVRGGRSSISAAGRDAPVAPPEALHGPGRPLGETASSIADRITAPDPLSAGLVAEVTTAAFQMESAGALLLAATVLASLRQAMTDAPPVVEGRVLTQWARVARQLGDFDIAADLYQDAGRLGAREGVAELQVRADLGLGELARMRGNYPGARERFRRALRQAEQAGLRQLTGFAHQLLLIAAAVAEDFDTALTHGWAAFAHAAGNPDREAEVLDNLGTLCLDMGHTEAALQAFRSAAARTSSHRMRIAAHAGMALAAARLGDRATLEQASATVERGLTDSTPFDTAQRLFTLANAWATAAQPETAAALRRRGLDLARAHGFAELMHRYEATVAAPATPEAPAELAPEARHVVRALAALNAPLVTAGAGGGSGA